MVDDNQQTTAGSVVQEEQLSELLFAWDSDVAEWPAEYQEFFRKSLETYAADARISDYGPSTVTEFQEQQGLLEEEIEEVEEEGKDSEVDIADLLGEARRQARAAIEMRRDARAARKDAREFQRVIDQLERQGQSQTGTSERKPRIRPGDVGPSKSEHPGGESAVLGNRSPIGSRLRRDMKR